MSVEWSHVNANASDGTRLSIERVRPSSGAVRGAVVLLHGLGVNRLTFMLPEVSLASHLAELGFDCFVPELRGTGRSQLPGMRWTIDEYIEQDIPAIVRAVQLTSGRSHMHWIGHSMGGILMMMYGIEHPDAPVLRFVAVGSGLDFRGGRNVYQALRYLRPLLGRLSVLPFAAIGSAAARVAGIGPVLPIEGMNFHRPNIERAICRRLMAEGFSSIPLSLVDSLATTFESRGFSRAGGRIVYLPRAHEFRVPALLIAGSKDPQCPPGMVQATCDALGSLHKQVRVFGQTHGHREDYGHFDLLLGRHAAREVWPEISSFLSLHETNQERAPALPV